MSNSFSFTTVLTAVVISVVLSTGLAFKITERSMQQDSPFLVVDFTELSKRLMVSMREEISQQDVSMNPEMIQLMAQSEARKLYNQVAMYNPDKIVLAKSQIIYNPSAVDITSSIASKMGLPEATDDQIQEFINGTAKSGPKPSDVVGVR